MCLEVKVLQAKQKKNTQQISTEKREKWLAEPRWENGRMSHQEGNEAVYGDKKKKKDGIKKHDNGNV